MAGVNPYLNTPPTELRRDLESEKDEGKRKQMTEAINAWRSTVPGPLRGDISMNQTAQDILKMARGMVSARKSNLMLEVKQAISAVDKNYNIRLDAMAESVILKKRGVPILMEVPTEKSRMRKTNLKKIGMALFRKNKRKLSKIQRVLDILLEDDGIAVGNPKYVDSRMKRYPGSDSGAVLVSVLIPLDINESAPDIPPRPYRLKNVIMVPPGVGNGRFFQIDKLTFNESRWKWVADMSAVSVEGDVRKAGSLVLGEKDEFGWKSASELKSDFSLNLGKLNKLKAELIKATNDNIEMNGASREEKLDPFLGDYNFNYVGGSNTATMVAVVGNIIDGNFEIRKSPTGGPVLSFNLLQVNPAAAAKKAAEKLKDEWAETLRNYPGVGRLKSPELDDLEDFVDDIRGWFDMERQGKGLFLNTRQNGSVGEEEYGDEDYRLAQKIRKQVIGKFGKAVDVDIEPVDEWVNIEISLR